MYATLTTLRDALAALPGVTSCRIGLEANMTPADYPMIRIVPSTARYGQTMGGRQCEVLIYFGQAAHEFDSGLEAQYEQLFEMEAAIMATAGALHSLIFVYQETIFGEDLIDAYKLMAIRATVEG